MNSPSRERRDDPAVLTPDRFPHVVDPKLRGLLVHWLEVRGDRLIPARGDLDPARIAPVLPFIWLCDYECGPDLLRYRLSGEELNTIYGYSLKGRELGSVFPESSRAIAVQRTLRVVRDRLVMHTIGAPSAATWRRGHGERLILPLGDDENNPDGLVAATVFDLRDRRPLAQHSQAVTLTYTPVDGTPGPEPEVLTVGLPWEAGPD